MTSLPSCLAALAAELATSARLATSIVLLTLAAIPAADGATYYIDYDGGRDSNAGTRDQPWSRHPYMNGWTGSYSHTSGDRFIFKGGVTWPASAFQILIRAGGSGEQNRDYYGVDTTWYAGQAFSKPLFDFQNTILSIWGGTSLSGVRILDSSYITIDGIEMARHRVPLPSSGVGLWGASTMVIENASSYITITNCVIRDWDQPLPVPSGGDAGGGIINIGSGGGIDIKILGCTLHQFGTAAKTGRAISVAGEIGFNTIHDTVNAILGSGVIHDNHIYKITAPSDGQNHPNAIGTFSPCQLYNNIIHDLWDGASGVFVGPDWYGPTTKIDLIYNNVVFNCGLQAPIQMDTNGQSPESTGARVFNNTLEHGSSVCVRVVYRPEAPRSLGTLDVRNNHFITTATEPVLYNNPGAGGANVLSATVSANTTMSKSEAEAAGMYATGYWAPPGASTPLYNTGVDLSSFFTSSVNGLARPQGGLWDRGAYEISAPTYSLAVSSSPTSGVSITLNPTDDTGANLGVTDFTLTYKSGTTVTLTAPATSNGNTFSAWQLDGVTVGAAPVLSVVMTANRTARAIYLPPAFYNLTVSSQPANVSVTVGVSPLDRNGAGPGLTTFIRSYESGTTVSLVAPAAAGANVFQKWQKDGVNVGTAATITVKMDAAHAMKAFYRKK